MKTPLLIVLFFILCLFSCSVQKSDYFSDSKNTIKPGEFKIAVIQKNEKDFSTVYFTLFKKSNNSWKKIQTGEFEKQPDFYLSVDPSEDLNNDGFLDLKIAFAQAGRGSNSLEKLLIYDPKLEKLIDIRNSQDYPNLHYNAKRNCINAHSFSGGNTTYFLNINNDRLEEFAHVYFDGDTVSVYKKLNNEDVLFMKKNYKSEDAATFFSDFDPLEE